MAQQQIGKQSASLAVRAREFIPVPQVFQKTEMPDARRMPEITAGASCPANLIEATILRIADLRK